MRGTPDRTAHARGNRLQLAPTGLASIDSRARLYALPGWGILVIRCGEKTTIARKTYFHGRDARANVLVDEVSGKVRLGDQLIERSVGCLTDRCSKRGRSGGLRFAGLSLSPPGSERVLHHR